MSTNYHTPTATASNPAVVNDVLVPDAALDQAITNLAGGAAVTDARLKEWTESEAYEPTSQTRNGDSIVTSATVKWPDGSAGTLTTDTINATFLAIDAYHISHTNSGKTVTQTAYTRNADGDITTKPALTVA